VSEEVEIVITLSSEWHTKPPKFKLFIDDNLIDEGYIEEKYLENKSKDFTWSGTLEDGPHKIRVEMIEKTKLCTVINEHGEIIKDRLLRINEVSIDQINLGFLVYKNCKFYPDKNKFTNTDDMIPNLDHIGYNGKWELDFEVPTYIWLLENL
jgi:hypothetical protein